MTLGFFLGGRRSIEVNATVFFTNGHAFLRHQLKQLQRRRVGEITIGGQDVVDLPDCARPTRPQHSQDVEFGVSGP